MTFSPQYYIAQAKAGFIAVTDHYEDQRVTTPRNTIYLCPA